MSRPRLEIAVSGGPAAGKTSVLPTLVEIFRLAGWRPLVVPEMATMLYSNGLDDIGELADANREAYVASQALLAGATSDLRRRYRRLAARLNEPVAIIVDRGELDIGGYLTAEETALALASVNLSPAQILDSYDLVLYLQTAAEQLASNPARRGGGPTRSSGRVFGYRAQLVTCNRRASRHADGSDPGLPNAGWQTCGRG